MTSPLTPVAARSLAPLRAGLRRLRRIAPVLVLAGIATLSSACVSFDQQTNLLTPSGNAAATTTAPPVDGSSSGSMVGVWASDSGFSVADVSTCAGFEWDISSQSPTVVYGSFSATCGGSLRITGTGSGTTVSANQVAMTVNGSAVIGGFAACSFSVNGVGTVMNSDTLVIPYEGTTCLGPVRGTETLRRKTSTPPAGPPEPPAPPPPPPPPTPTNPAPGGFDLASVTIVGSPDVRGWPITSRITSLRFGGGQIHLDHTRRGTWPPVVIANDGTTQESTLWVFFNINGKWYGTGGERWRPGQTDKALSKPSDIGPGWLYDPSRWGPMANYVPRPGELVGFMVAAGSTRSDATINVAERSDVVLINFPSDNGGAFPPFAWQEQ